MPLPSSVLCHVKGSPTGARTDNSEGQTRHHHARKLLASKTGYQHKRPARSAGLSPLDVPPSRTRQLWTNRLRAIWSVRTGSSPARRPCPRHASTLWGGRLPHLPDHNASRPTGDHACTPALPQNKTPQGFTNVMQQLL